MKRSRKRSDSSATRPLEEPTFFIDRSLGRYRFAERLKAAGLRVVIHDDLFAEDCPDEEWLVEAGRAGWVVVTKDRKIRYRSIEREALLDAGVRAIAMTSKGISGSDLGDLFVSARSRIAKLLASEGGPFIARLGRSGGPTVLVRRRPR